MAKKKQGKKTVLQWLLYIVSIYHLLLGVLTIFAKDLTVGLAKLAFNFNLTLTDQVYWVVNPLAAYLLAFGLFTWVAATNPVKYKKIIFAGVILFGVRVVQRLFFFLTAPKSLVSNVDPVRGVLFLLSITALGVALFILARKLPDSK